MVKEVESKANEEINSENIFDEFIDSQDSVNNSDITKNKRWVYDYLKTLNFVFIFVNLLLFLFIITLLMYNHFQSKEEKDNIAFLQPICNFLLGEVYTSWSDCYSVTSYLSEYQSKYQNLEKDTWASTVKLMSELYAINNFNYSKKVSFLLDKTNSRLKPLDILQSFDSIKREFTSSFERSNVSCSNIDISYLNEVSMSCDVFSSDWDTSIIDLNSWVRSVLPWGGTSISRANSFINFIENHGSGLFVIKDKPDSFTSSPTSDQWPYTRVTTIDMTLQYINPEYLSF